MISGARHFEKLDKTLVCSQAGPAPPLPFRESSEPSLDRDDHPLVLRADRETLEEGWLLLQALPPHGPVHLGEQGSGGRVAGSRRPAPSHLPSYLSSSHECSWQMLDGRSRACSPLLVSPHRAQEQEQQRAGGDRRLRDA